jgi:PAS domain S-box-containing protein
MTPPTILVIEDNAKTRKMLRVTLETEGYSVIEAPDGRAALAAIERELPALILHDQVLPDMSGVDLERQLLAQLGATAVPILALSGLIRRHDDAPRTPSVSPPSLIGPIEPAQLMDVIRSYVPLPMTRLQLAQGRRVLVVDDDPIQLKLTCLHLQLLGFEVRPASTTGEAIALALAEVPDVIFSDVLMPGLDGFQLCFEVRKQPSLRNVPVVLASAWYETEEDRELARKVGATALVRKTPDLTEVAHSLFAAIEADPPLSNSEPTVEVRLVHARAVIRQLERQLATSADLARRCTLQATQMTLLSGASDAFALNADGDSALRDILAATLDAAGISKGVIYLRGASGRLVPRQAVGFSSSEQTGLHDFFGQLDTLERVVRSRATVVIPTMLLRNAEEATILRGAGSKSAQLVPLSSEGQGVGALVLLASATDVTTDDTIIFARAMGKQLAQSLELASFFARLTASERRYRAVTEAAHDAISISRDDGLIVDINPSFEATLGRDREQIIGHRMQEFAVKGRERKDIDPLGQLSAALDRSPLPLARPDGSVALMEFSNRAVEIAGEKLWVAIGRDVTERVETQAQLMFSDRMATVGSLAAGVAHEINNPLTAVIANLHFALEELAMATMSTGAPACLASIAELLREAGEGADRVADIARDLKIFSRAEEDIRGPVDLPRVLESAARMARTEIRHRAELVQDYADIPFVDGNESRLGQVFLNLLINAAQSLPEGHASKNRIVLRTRCDTAGFITVDVEDTGSGISPENLARMFTPFFTTKPRGVGTGLGLSICKRIVSSFGGEITVASEVGRGTTFRVRLRTSTAQAKADAHPPSAAAPPLRRGRILIVDDDDMAARAICRVLTEAHDVLVSHDATQSLARIVGGERFDVIICDVMMPDKTGPEFFRELSVHAPDQSDRIIFLTGGAFTVAARDFLDRVPNPWLEKPFDVKSLRTLINARLISGTETSAGVA